MRRLWSSQWAAGCSWQGGVTCQQLDLTQHVSWLDDKHCVCHTGLLLFREGRDTFCGPTHFLSVLLVWPLIFQSVSQSTVSHITSLHCPQWLYSLHRFCVFVWLLAVKDNRPATFFFPLSYWGFICIFATSWTTPVPHVCADTHAHTDGPPPAFSSVFLLLLLSPFSLPSALTLLKPSSVHT